MASRSELWELVEPVVAEAGLVLFDIDLPSGKGGIMRIYIASSEKAQVTIDDCAKISKELGALDDFDAMLPERTTLEVSSPGVNRKLRRQEHFSDAVGERIKVKVCDENNKRHTFKGVLEAFDGGVLKVRTDKNEELVDVLYSDISEARIDFKFQ